MSVKPSDAITIDFTTQDASTGAATDADSLPTGKLVVNGTDNAATVTVTNKETGVYKAAVTLPAELSAGDEVQIRIAATVSTIAGKAVIWTDQVDTKIVSELQDIAAGALMGLANDAITSAKFDESSAYPLKSADTGATQVARVGADGDTLETLSDQVDSVAVPGSEMGLANDAITLAKYDETTAFALQSVDTGATQVARTGADSDTLETLSDQIDGISLTGSYDVDLQLYKTATTTPIPDVIISVKNANQSLLLGVLTTDSLGQASMSRDAGTYKLLCQKSGFTFTSPETLTVTSGSVSQTIYGTEWTAPTAPTVYTCIVYGWVKDVDNTGLLAKTVSAKLHQTPAYYSGVGYSAIQSASDTTDATGYFELTLTRSRYMTTTTGDAGRYTLTIGEAKLIWVIEVPDAASAKFDDIRV